MVTKRRGYSRDLFSYVTLGMRLSGLYDTVNAPFQSTFSMLFDLTVLTTVLLPKREGRSKGLELRNI